MDPIDLCRRYFDAWRRRDAAAILDTFAPGGTYTDPTTGGPLAREQFRGYVDGLWSAFPDLDFEPGSVERAGADRVVGTWRMTGTNTGSMSGLPPTGRRVDLPGVDLIRTGAQGIESVQGYFDSAVVPRQLGLQVVVQPEAIGPFAFGTSTLVRTGKSLRPGAVALTELIARSDEEVARIRELSRQIAIEMLGQPGFIGLTASVSGRRMTTVSVWDSPESPQQAMRGPAHAQAMSRFFGDGLAEGGSTSVWQPLRFGAQWRRCPACGRMNRLEADSGRCACGESLTAVA